MPDFGAMTGFFLRFFTVCFVLCGVSACAPEVTHYHQEKPILLPERFFNGKLTAWGVVTDWRGRATKRFRMDAEASWQGNSGKMDEFFTYADGSTQNRHWTFTKTVDHRFTGTAPDVIGKAQGVASGNALHWVYTIRIPSDKGSHDVTFDDWLYLIDENHLFSLVTIRKFGIKLGTLTMFFTKE